jgi:hypothetical protein
VRRLVLLTAIAVMAFAGVAYAVTNTLTYTSKMSYKGKPTTKKPKNLAYQGTLHIDTDPQGQQPEAAPVTSVYFAKGIKNNARYWPFCNQSEIDGQPSLPAKCKKAIVGTGTASALAGGPGNPSTQSIREDLKVTAVNGTKGRSIYLVLNSEPGAPVQITNRVVPGAVKTSSGAFAFLVRFAIPADLQEQLGLAISLTDFDVKISSKARTIKVKRKKVKASYLQLTSCKGSKPVKAITQFRDKDTRDLKTVTSTSSSRC